MSAAAMNLLMANYTSQLQNESGLHLRNNNTPTQHQQQQHHQMLTYNNTHNLADSNSIRYCQGMNDSSKAHSNNANTTIISPTGSPVRQLKRLHPGATNTATEMLRCRRNLAVNTNSALHSYNMNYHSGVYGHLGAGSVVTAASRQVSSVARRNERERNRVRLVNHGFALLRQHVPAMAAKSKKMSKVDTLKAAVDYIQQLRDVLREADALEESNKRAEKSSSSRRRSTSSNSGSESDQENGANFLQNVVCHRQQQQEHQHQQHPRLRFDDDGCMSPASSSGSCPDGSSSPVNSGYSSGSDDGGAVTGASSPSSSTTSGGFGMGTSGLELHQARALNFQQHLMSQQRHLATQNGTSDDDNDLHIEDFASWFC